MGQDKDCDLTKEAETLRESASDTPIRFYNTNPALLGGNCYQRFPARASWQVGWVLAREDGSTYRIERSCFRWGSETIFDPFERVDGRG
jgi:hypothetical protein